MELFNFILRKKIKYADWCAGLLKNNSELLLLLITYFFVNIKIKYKAATI